MPTIAPAQTSFSGGEASPRLHGRVDLDWYKTALALCRDAAPTPQGSLVRRPGSQYLGPIATSEGARLVPFKLQDGTDLMLELGNLTARVYDRFGMLAGIGANQIVNGNFAGSLASWVVDHALADVVDNQLRIGVQMSQDYVAGFIHQDVVLAAAGTYELSWTVSAERWNNGYGAGDLGVSVQQGSMGIASKASFEAGTYSLTFEVTDTVTPVRVYISTHRTNSKQVYGGYYIQSFWFKLDNVSLGLVGGDLEIVTPWTLAQLADLQWVTAPGQSRAYFAHPDVAPYELIFTSRLVWTLQSLVFTGAPAAWGAANYPSVVELFQGRLWLGATRQQPTQVWFSKSGTVDVFTDGSNPGDASSFLLQTKGSVRWLRGAHFLLIGTESGEYAATGSNGVLAPGDIQVRPISAFGAAKGHAAFVGGEVVFVAGDKRKVRAADYTLERNTWQTKDLTFASEHITAGKVKEVHYARDPNGALVGLLEDGSLAVANYNPTEQVRAWFLWKLLGGYVKQAAVMEVAEGSLVWMIAQRVVNGATVNYLEILDLGDQNDVFLDCAVRRPVTAGVITGLAHLEGELVQVVMGRSVVGSFTVAAGAVDVGDAELAGNAIVGLPYNGVGKTLKPEGGNPRGSAQGTKRRRVRIVVRLNDSAVPLLNGERPYDRNTSTPMDEGEGAVTGDLELKDLGWADDGQVTITMDLPLRTEVLAIFGTEQVNQL